MKINVHPMVRPATLGRELSAHERKGERGWYTGRIRTARHFPSNHARNAVPPQKKGGKGGDTPQKPRWRKKKGRGAMPVGVVPFYVSGPSLFGRAGRDVILDKSKKSPRRSSPFRGSITTRLAGAGQEGRQEGRARPCAGRGVLPFRLRALGGNRPIGGKGFPERRGSSCAEKKKETPTGKKKENDCHRPDKAFSRFERAMEPPQVAGRGIHAWALGKLEQEKAASIVPRIPTKKVCPHGRGYHHPSSGGERMFHALETVIQFPTGGSTTPGGPSSTQLGTTK